MPKKHGRRHRDKYVHHLQYPSHYEWREPYGFAYGPGYGGYGGSIATRQMVGSFVPYHRYHAISSDPYLYRCTWDPEWNPAACHNVFNFHSSYSYYSPFGNYWW